MNRRDSLKAIGLTALSTGVLIQACKPGEEKQATAGAEGEIPPGRQEFEVARDKDLNATKFFNDHEMATITVLVDIIIPKDDKSGSASDAGVPAFIEFIVKDMPQHQIPMRGGLQWLDRESSKRFQKIFTLLTPAQRIQIVDDIAYPENAKPVYSQGVAFFNLMRNLTASGFYTTRIGIDDIGYVGNTPNMWAGPPEEVLKQYGFTKE